MFKSRFTVAMFWGRSIWSLETNGHYLIGVCYPEKSEAGIRQVNSDKEWEIDYH